MSLTWLNKWKKFIGFDGDEDMEDSHPGACNNEDLVEETDSQIVCDQSEHHLNVNLKDGLREDEHYMILNEKVWSFFVDLYGGREIIRYGRVDENGNESIEVYLARVNIYFFPMAQSN